MSDDLPIGGPWHGRAEDHHVKNVIVLGGVQFPGVAVTFYDDGTTWIDASRRLTADELAKIVGEARRWSKRGRRRA